MTKIKTEIFSIFTHKCPKPEHLYCVSGTSVHLMHKLYSITTAMDNKDAFLGPLGVNFCFRNDLIGCWTIILLCSSGTKRS